MRATIVYSDGDGGNAVIIERDRDTAFCLSYTVAYELRKIWLSDNGAQLVTVEFERGELEKGY